MNPLKIIFFSLFFLLSAKSLQAQIFLGQKVGSGYSSFVKENYEPEEEKIEWSNGLQFGLVTQFKINAIWAIQPEFLYFQKGSKLNVLIPDEEEERAWRLNYFEMPLLAKIKINPTGDPIYFATIGPSFGLGINGKYNSNGNKEKFHFYQASLDEFDFSASIGAGAQFAAGNGTLTIDARYLMGIISVAPGIKNRGINFSTALLLPLILR